MSRPKIDEIEKRIEQLKAQKQAIMSREKQKERKERTKRLIEIGAIIEKGLQVDSKFKAMALVEYLTKYPDSKAKINAFITKQEAILKQKKEKENNNSPQN